MTRVESKEKHATEMGIASARLIADTVLAMEKAKTEKTQQAVNLANASGYIQIPGFFRTPTNRVSKFFKGAHTAKAQAKRMYNPKSKNKIVKHLSKQAKQMSHQKGSKGQLPWYDVIS